MISLEARMTPEEQALLAGLDSPFRIQAYLDSLLYNGDDRNRSPLGVIREAECHCLDGGLLGAAALRRLGFRPLLIDLWPEPGTDDDHVLALFRVDSHWGALAKSNFASLRFREPVYRSVRELVMSYFDVFYNADGVKTLRSYTLPLDLSRYDRQDWEVEPQAAGQIEQHLHRLRTYPVISAKMAANLSPVDERAYAAGLYGSNPEGLFKLH